MKILHTSDWHLGKHLEMSSRLPEQIELMDELIQIADNNDIDLVVVAGDVYDNSNPPADAERLFYESVSRLSAFGRRPVLIIAGNHDNPDRLSAAASLAVSQGIIIIGTQDTVIPIGDYGHYSVVDSGKGWLELNIGAENTIAVTVPYLSEKRINQLFADSTDEKSMQKSYIEKMNAIFQELSGKYREDTVNIAIGHFFISGGETSDSERDIQLGGSYAIPSSLLPEKAQYIAMGHLHRPQAVKGCANAFYSGSPIQYSKSEINYAKCVYIADLQPGKDAVVEKVYLRNYKPIEVWKADGIDDALTMCRKQSGENSWVFLEIRTDRVLLQSEIKEIHSLKKDIIMIQPILTGQENVQPAETFEDRTMLEEFTDFYLEARGVAPSDKLISLFCELSSGEEDGYETDTIENQRS